MKKVVVVFLFVGALVVGALRLEGAVLFYEGFDQFTATTNVMLQSGVGLNQWYRGTLLTGGPRNANGQWTVGSTTYTAASPPPGFTPNSGWSVSTANNGTGYNSSGSLNVQPIAWPGSGVESLLTLGFIFRQGAASGFVHNYYHGIGIGDSGVLTNVGGVNYVAFTKGSTAGSGQLPNGYADLMLYILNQQHGAASNAFVISTPSGFMWWNPTYNHVYYTGGSYATGVTYEVKLRLWLDGTPAHDKVEGLYRAFDQSTSSWGPWWHFTPGPVTAGKNFDGMNFNAIQFMGGDFWFGVVMDNISLEWNLVPEPSTSLLIGVGAVLIGWWRVQKGRRAGAGGLGYAGGIKV
ncbi:MAG: PEP-CTERM sorting domain-containing protein [Verrucomicrobiae bacterium]|nr:PEP-CTERM sorting domain-containing protein [Verrucomicrobiae bacterium]